MRAYLDSSVVLSRLLSQEPRLPDSEWNAIETAFASDLIRVEIHRVLERIALQGRWPESAFIQAITAAERLLSGVTMLPVARPVLERATQPFGLALGTLDALHLASALLLRDHESGDDWVFCTHDARLASAARVFRFRVSGAE